jgi:hypothetical protein
MEYESGRKINKKRMSAVEKTRWLRRIVLFLIIAVFIGGAIVFLPWGKMGRADLVRLKNTIAHLVLRQAPHFYYLDVEKNGKDERLTTRDALTVSYRDEFVIKGIVSDDLFGKSMTVDVEGLGDRNDYRRILKGVELVDQWIMSAKAPDQASGVYEKP